MISSSDEEIPTTTLYVDQLLSAQAGSSNAKKKLSSKKQKDTSTTQISKTSCTKIYRLYDSIDFSDYKLL